MVRRHKVPLSRTSIKPDALLTVICGVAVMVMQGFIMLTRSAEEGIEGAANGMVNATVQTEIIESHGQPGKRAALT